MNIQLPWYENADTIVACHRLVMLVGEPGCGKTTYARQRGEADCGHSPEVLQGTPETELSQVWGMYTLEGGNTRFSDGPLPRALKRGRHLLVEEFNLIPLEARASLLALRESGTVTNPFSGEEIDIPATFRLIATSNPENMSCQRNAAVGRALMDDFLVLEVPEPDEVELTRLLRANFPKAGDSEVDEVMRAYSLYHEIESGSKASRNPIRLGYRAAAHMLALLRAGLSPSRAATIAMINKYIIDPDLHESARTIQSLHEDVEE